MSRPREITKKLKEGDPELSGYIIELEKENLRLHKQIAKLQAKNLSKDKEIKALKGVKPIHFSMPIVFGENNGE